MKWYRKLYLGENASKAKYKIWGYIRKNRFQVDTFLIVVSSNPNALLEIFSANVLNQPHFKNKHYTEDMYVVGLAKGRDEANELVRTIIDDVYTHTGGFDISDYLKFGQKLRR